MEDHHAPRTQPGGTLGANGPVNEESNSESRQIRFAQRGGIQDDPCQVRRTPQFTTHREEPQGRPPRCPYTQSLHLGKGHVRTRGRSTPRKEPKRGLREDGANPDGPLEEIPQRGPPRRTGQEQMAKTSRGI